MSKFEQLLDLLVNEQKDEAEKLFHEIVVEKSRQIYEGILADEEAVEENSETDEVEEASDKADDAETDEVDEAMHGDKDDKKKKKMKKEDEVDEAMHGDKEDKKKKKEKKMEDASDEDDVEEGEEPAESSDETIEEIGGDQTDDLISDIEAEGHGDDMGDMDKDDDMDMDDDGDSDPETAEMFAPLEKELDELKAEFAKMMDSDDDKPEEGIEPFEGTESKDADTIVKEYANMVKDGHGAEKMGSEKGADSKKSVVASKNKPMTNAGPVKMDVGGEEKGGVGKALTGDTAKPMGDSFKNAGGIKSASQEKAPSAMEKPAGEDNTKSPVAAK
jgi:hypothetical protein